MILKNPSYKEVLLGEAALNAMVDEIRRSCSLISWVTEDEVRVVYPEATAARPELLRIDGPTGEDFWWSLYFAHGLLRGISFYHLGYVLGSWKEDGTFKLVEKKLATVPKIHAKLQTLFDGVGEKFPRVPGRLGTIASIAVP